VSTEYGEAVVPIFIGRGAHDNLLSMLALDC
jgi:hypothetical protein